MWSAVATKPEEASDFPEFEDTPTVPTTTTEQQSPFSSPKQSVHAPLPTTYQQQELASTAVDMKAELTSESIENMSIEEMLEWSARSVALVAEEQKALESTLSRNVQDTEGEGVEEWTQVFQERLTQLKGAMGELKESMQQNETNLEKFGRTIDEKIEELEKEQEQYRDESQNV